MLKRFSIKALLASTKLLQKKDIVTALSTYSKAQDVK